VSLLDEAWAAYYAFAFGRALDLLLEAEELLESPGDGRSRSRLAFEVNILKGMVYRAEGDGRYKDEFKKAAAVSPAAELSPERYSPEIISAYSRTRDELFSGETVLVVIDASPDDAGILVDGKAAEREESGTRLQVFPGRHFIQVGASGYEPFSHVLQVREWDSPSLEFDLSQIGPEGELDSFFLKRLKAGDRLYLSRLLEKLGVDYVLIPDGGGGSLHPWLVGRDGRAAAHGTIWETGDDPDSAVRNLSAMLKPLRQDREDIGNSVFTQMNLPPFPAASPKTSGEAGRAAVWKRYAPVLGVLVLLAVAVGSGSGGGGTSVEVTW
jgi:hypothetical protein